jgi:choline dehydrogenase
MLRAAQQAALALRIRFEGDRAVGVEIARDGQVEQIRGEREVILSAGSYQSPVLLMGRQEPEQSIQTPV